MNKIKELESNLDVLLTEKRITENKLSELKSEISDAKKKLAAERKKKPAKTTDLQELRNEIRRVRGLLAVSLKTEGKNYTEIAKYT